MPVSIKKAYSFRIAILFIGLSLMLSCSGQQNDNKDTIVNKLIAGLKANDEQGIYNMSYHIDTRNHITDEDIRKRFCETGMDTVT